MRTLKFRSYDTVEQAYCPFITYHLDRELYPHIDVQQWTGLLSKDGVEIYEGDIVRGRFIEKDVPDAMWLTLSEQEKEQGFRLFTIDTIFEPYQTPMPDDIEVIGNIYEHSHLLEANQ